MRRIMKDIVPDRSREQDSREAVLAFAESAEKNPVYIGRAYKATLPRTMFDEILLERESLSIILITCGTAFTGAYVRGT